jgi:hypothetical protein
MKQTREPFLDPRVLINGACPIHHDHLVNVMPVMLLVAVKAIHQANQAIITTNVAMEEARQAAVSARRVADDSQTIVKYMQPALMGASDVVKRLQPAVNGASNMLNAIQPAVDGASSVTNVLQPAVAGAFNLVRGIRDDTGADEDSSISPDDSVGVQDATREDARFARMILGQTSPLSLAAVLSRRSRNGDGI